LVIAGIPSSSFLGMGVLPSTCQVIFLAGFFKVYLNAVYFLGKL